MWNFHSTASIDLWVEWQGTTAHAGAMPWEGRSALHAAKVLAATGLDLLTDPDFLKAVQDYFVKQRNGRTYKTLNDSKTNPLGKLDTSEMKHYECCIHSAMDHFGIKEHQ